MKYSKIIHWLAVCTLFLPFYIVGCKKDAQPVESGFKLDTTAVADTSLPAKKSSLVSDSTKAKSFPEEDISNKDPYCANKVADKAGIFRYILVPKPYTYSGIGTVLNTVELVPYTGTLVFVFLLLLALIAKYMEANALKTIVLLEFFSLFMLAIAVGDFVMFERLWGYWLAFAFTAIVLILDAYLAVLQYRKRSE